MNKHTDRLRRDEQGGFTLHDLVAVCYQPLDGHAHSVWMLCCVCFCEISWNKQNQSNHQDWGDLAKPMHQLQLNHDGVKTHSGDRNEENGKREQVAWPRPLGCNNQWN